jgi:hypothetical protein
MQRLALEQQAAVDKAALADLALKKAQEAEKRQMEMEAAAAAKRRAEDAERKVMGLRHWAVIWVVLSCVNPQATTATTAATSLTTGPRKPTNTHPTPSPNHAQHPPITPTHPFFCHHCTGG